LSAVAERFRQTWDPSPSSVITWGLIAVVTLAILLDQILYIIKRKHLPGPTLVWPFVGSIVRMVLDPGAFWHAIYKMKLSVNSFFGYFVVVTTEASSTRKVFEECSDNLQIATHPNAPLLLGYDNLCFLNGETHISLRKQFIPMFTPKSLGVYCPIQQEHIHRFIKQWLDESAKGVSPMEMKPRCWELNCHMSISVFVGPYLPEGPRRDVFVNAYRTLTDGFLSFPINLPGFALNRAVKARRVILQHLERVSADCKAEWTKNPDGAIRCLLDVWIQPVAQQLKQGIKVPHSSDAEVANTVLDFLFASQDASTSSLTWTFHLLSEHPHVLAKVREEQMRLRPTGNEPITVDMLAQMRYTHQTMKEMLRFRAPAPMLPHLVKNKTYQLTEDYSAPAGSLVCPIIWEANHRGFPDGWTFDPDRFGPERDEGKTHEKAFMTFGAGPHYCAGQRYAMQHLMMFLAVLARDTEWSRRQTPKMHEFMYAPTVYPGDGCLLDCLRPTK